MVGSEFFLFFSLFLPPSTISTPGTGYLVICTAKKENNIRNEK